MESRPEIRLSIFGRFDPPRPSAGFFPPPTILGMPVAAGLNQKNSTSLSLGTQTAFDFHPPPADLTPYYNRHLNPKMLNGVHNPPKPCGGSNLVSYFVSYFWDATLEPILKMRIGLQCCVAGRTAGSLPRAPAENVRSSAKVLWRTPLFRHPAPCSDPRSTVFEIGSSKTGLKTPAFRFDNERMVK